MRPVVKLFAAILILAAAAARPAFAAEPAQAPINALDDKLIEVMKDAKSLGFKGRYAVLKPVIEQTLDLATMTRIAVGPTWTGMTPAQQASLVEGFSRLTIASYAHNFDGYSGQRFVMAPNVDPKGQDKVVQTRLVSKSDEVKLAYRMRQIGGAWKVVDIYYNGSISELTTRRSDFGATLASGGAKGLIASLNAQADKLSR